MGARLSLSDMWVTMISLLFIGLAAGLAFYKKWLAPHIFGAIERAHEDAALLVDIACVLDLDRPLPRMGGWAISPDLCLWLIEYVQREKPELVVELGAGSSTLILGKALQRFTSNGRLVSVESGERYSDSARRLAAEWGLDNVEVRHAPLEEKWYRRSSLADLHDIDLLLVDGPPGNSGQQARYPAVSLFPHLSSSGVVVLDDGARPEEALAVRRWTEEFPMKAETLPLPRGVVLLSRTSS